MISRETVDEILIRNDIESLIGSYVSLKRAGSNLKGLCPFHNEKTPSFTVYPADNSFYCFGCGVGGNAVTFVRQIEHLDYPDALEFLAKRAGITIVRESDNKLPTKKGIGKDRLLQMNVDAAKFFHAMLFADNPDSKAALSYFVNQRHLSLATIKHFGLGYAPNSYDATIKYLSSKGYTKDEMVEAFFAMKSEKGTYYDAFRNRVMFPIIDVSGGVIAFGGRVLDDSKPKYRNTMDTPVFKKSYNLFALNFARKVCSEQIVLCEGYMDVIALHSAGFTNAVATLGTAITPDQAKLMKRYTKKVIICYDADEAGQKATQKAIRLLGEAGLDVSVIKVPGAKDPDEYIKSFGKEKFAEVINGSKSKFEYNMDSVLSRFDINLPQDKINALHEIEKMISEVYSRAEQDIYINSVSKKFDVKYENIRQDVEKIIKKNLLQQRREEREKIKNSAQGYSDRVNPDFAKAPAVASNEETVLGLLLLYPEHRKKIKNEGLLCESDFYTELGKRVFGYAMNMESEGDNDDINLVFTPAEVGRITKMKLARMSLSDNGDAVFLESVNSLKNSMLKKNATSLDNLNDLNNFINSIRNNEKDGKNDEQ